MIREAKAYWVIKANNLERAIKKEATLRHVLDQLQNLVSLTVGSESFLEHANGKK